MRGWPSGRGAERRIEKRGEESRGEQRRRGEGRGRRRVKKSLKPAMAASPQASSLPSEPDYERRGEDARDARDARSSRKRTTSVKFEGDERHEMKGMVHETLRLCELCNPSYVRLLHCTVLLLRIYYLPNANHERPLHPPGYRLLSYPLLTARSPYTQANPDQYPGTTADARFSFNSTVTRTSHPALIT